jgi:hypothetical protein
MVPAYIHKVPLQIRTALTDKQECKKFVTERLGIYYRF